MPTPSDRQWLADVRSGHPRGPFGHREHLRLAWLLLDDTGFTTQAEEELSRIVEGIAVAHGKPQRYNRTLTGAWVKIVAHCRNVGGGASFEELLRRHPWLLDKRIITRHYTSRRLASAQARKTWVAPDLRPLPSA
ncbi:MAG TPA: hypothetical protein VFJ09_06990 [Nocardioidaceae bacterium]|nr:hypothetical protein [Nocardioidaceae bacterium]